MHVMPTVRHSPPGWPVPAFPGGKMRHLLAFIFVMLLPASALAQSSADNQVSSVTIDGLERMVLALDSEVLRRDPDDTNPGVVGRASNGLVYILRGYACTDNINCLGIEIMVIFDLEDANVTLADANSFNQRWAAVKFNLRDNSLIVSRYEILDFGRSFNNVIESLFVVLEISETLAAEIYD
jgi:hypothetical protein